MILVATVMIVTLQSPTVELLNERGFSLDQTGSRYMNDERRAFVRFGVSQLSIREHEIGRVLKGFDRLSVRPGEAKRVGASGLLIGRDARYAPGKSQIILESCSFQTRVRVKMQCGQQRFNGVPKPISALSNDDYTMVEAIARWELATKTAEAYAASTYSLSGQSVPCRRSGNIRIHLDAARWAQLKGYTFRLNRDTGCAVVGRPQGTILLPLGSPKVKVGTEWIDIEDVVLADGEKPMIPLQVINRLN